MLDGALVLWPVPHPHGGLVLQHARRTTSHVDIVSDKVMVYTLQCKQGTRTFAETVVLY